MTTDTIEFPTIEAAPVAVVNPPAAPDLAKVDLTEVALAQFGDWSADVRKVRENLSTLVLDLTTQAKVDEAKSLRHRLIGQPRADVRKVSKALKSKLTAVSKAVGALEDAAVAAYDKAEELITPQIDKRQAELDAEREERLRVERERVAGLQAKLDALQLWADRCQEPGMTADRIKAGQNALAQIEFTRDEWQEFYDRAILRRVDVLAAMQTEFERKLVAESEARRLEEQRADAARIQALLDERQRALDVQAAELKRQAEDLAAQRAESERLAADNRARMAAQQIEDARVGALAEQRRQDAAAESARIAASTVPAFDLVATPEGDKGPAWEDGPGEPLHTHGEPRDQTPAEIEAANGPEVDLPPMVTGSSAAICQVDRGVRPHAWLCERPMAKGGGGFMTCDELAMQHYMQKFSTHDIPPVLVPLYNEATLRAAISAAWGAGYWHNGYTNDAAYADAQAEALADELLGSELGGR